MEPTHLSILFPDDRSTAELSARAARLHADLIIRRLQALECSPEQKQEILNRLVRQIQGRP